MAKKRKTKKKAASSSPQHKLPAGFWQQVTALALIAVSILLVVAWFGAGGPVLEWVQKTALLIIGGAVYVVPFLFIYVGVEIFRAEQNKLPLVMKFATVLFLVWVAGIAGLLFTTPAGDQMGGIVGNNINELMLQLVDKPIALFMYVLLIFVTLLFLFRASPIVIIKRIWALMQTERFDVGNVKVMREAAETDNAKSKKRFADFKLNAGVETLDPNATDDKQSSRMSSFKGSIKPDKAAEEQSALVSVSDPNWRSPSLDLLEKQQSPANAGDVQQNAKIIQDTLSEFSIDVEMEGANIGPKVTQYRLSPPSGVKLTKITALETNIALNLAAKSIRIEAPIPGLRAVGIEVPNLKAADVRLYGILTSKQWKGNSEPLAFGIGRDIAGEAVMGELNKMPHLLIAGQTGSGKSVMINTLLTSLLYRNSPSEMKLILVDPKQVEMASYDDIPHLLTPVITEPEKTISALKWAVNEMERRYKLLAEKRIKDIRTYNTKMAKSSTKIAVQDDEGNVQEHDEGAMPYIVIVIDELADLMMVAGRDVEALIVRLAQKARAVGIHLVLATQRPSVNVITGLIKANIPARIAFTVASQVDSRTILDQVGAEKLLGQGDMLLYTPSMSKPIRVQGAWVTDDEVEKITEHLRMQSAPQYNDEIISQPVQLNGKGGVVMDFQTDTSGDQTYQEALRFVVETGKASASVLQRRFGIGYAKAARYIDTMEEQGIVGQATGNSKPRDVLVRSLDELGGGDEDLG
jgi:S-DNA-T family DNA segregation ATPase FtsK/SpoIIIE